MDLFAGQHIIFIPVRQVLSNNWVFEDRCCTSAYLSIILFILIRINQVRNFAIFSPILQSPSLTKHSTFFLLFNYYL